MENLNLENKNITTLMNIIKKSNLFFMEKNETNKFDHKIIAKKLEELLQNNENLKIENFNSLVKEDSIIIYLDGDIVDNTQKQEEVLDYDIRILIGKEDNETKIAERISEALNRDQEYVSTRGSLSNSVIIPVSLLNDVIRDGLAKDRGLFVPKYFPKFEISQWERLVNKSYSERCLRILENFPIGGLKPNKLFQMINEAYSTFTNEKVLPLLKLDNNQYIMEEYFGPSASFKDLALQLFPRLFKEAISDNNFNEKIAVLVATSGDTGSAVLSGFKEIGIPVIVLYPYGKVSQIQKAQMTTAEGNVKVFGVRGDFDFCQNTVKDIFQDIKFTDSLKEKYNLNLTSANSINWGRLLPQVLYTIHSYLELVKEGAIKIGDLVDVCIPCGNFGNILGAFIAKRMGLPLDKLICASNENNILTDFINTGEFDLRSRNFKETISPAIDILIPSNIERLLYFLTNDSDKVKSYFEELQKNKYFKIDDELQKSISKDFLADCCVQEEVLETIKDVYIRTGYIIDPHTAVAKNIADKYSKKRSNPVLIAATAHYSKFPETVMKALDIPQSERLSETIEKLKKIETKSAFHRSLEDIMNKKVLHEEVLDADVDVIKARIFELAEHMIN